MRALVALVLVATAARPALAERAAVSLYDYEARAQLVAAYEQAGDYSSAYYQAAWLAWLGPRQCAESSAGARYLRDRRARDRAASKGGMEVAAVVAAMDAERHLSESCFNGVIAAQAERLRGQTADYITQVEKAAASQTRDPVVRMALVHLYVTLDDVLAVQGGAAGWRERLPFPVTPEPSQSPTGRNVTSITLRVRFIERLNFGSSGHFAIVPTSAP